MVFLTGHGDIPSTVHAMRAAAVDLLEKNTAQDVLLEAIRRALANLIDNAAEAMQGSLRRGWFHGVAFAVHRRVFEAIGFPDTDRQLGGREDVEYLIRCLRHDVEDDVRAADRDCRVGRQRGLDHLHAVQHPRGHRPLSDAE